MHIFCDDYPTLANHDPVQLQGTYKIYDFGFKSVHGNANEITSVEHKVDGNNCMPRI